MERLVPLFPDILSFSACLAVELPGRRYAALQRKYACTQYAERADVPFGCRTQLLPYFSDTADRLVGMGIYHSRRRFRREGCDIGYSIGRIRHHRRNDVVSLPSFSHAKTVRKTGKFPAPEGYSAQGCPYLPADGIRTHCHLWSANCNDGNRRTSRHHCHCRQLIRHHCRKSLLYARLRYLGSCHDTGRTKPRGKPHPAAPSFCQYYRLVGDADYGCHGSFDVCGGSANHRSDDSCGGDPYLGG